MPIFPWEPVKIMTWLTGPGGVIYEEEEED